MKKVLFWDFDGTIVYSNSLWTDSAAKALKTYSNHDNITSADIRPYMRSGFTWHTPDNDYTTIAKDESWWVFMNKHFSSIYQKLGIEKSEADYISTKIREQILNIENYFLFDDTISTLRACKEAGYENYILSNNYPELPQVIEELGIAPYFSDYIVSALIGYDKPRKEIFEAALEAANYPDICYMIGDNPVADIVGSKNVGMQAILVHKDVQSDADYVCTDLQDILKVLKIVPN